MRRSLLFAALLGCTAIVKPAPVNAEPVSTFIATQILISAGAGWTISAATALAIGSIATNLVVGIGLSAISGLLFKPDIPTPAQRMFSYAQPMSFQERIYGEVRKSGPLGFTAPAPGSRHYSTIVCAHPSVGPQGYYLDETLVTLNGAPTIKAKVATVTTANITLSGEQTINGVAVISGDRVLVKDQADPAENGIYVASTGAWVRAADMNADGEVQGAAVSWGGTWYWVEAFAGTIGTDDVVWSSGVDLGPAEVQTSPYAGHGSLRAYTGADGQPADATMVDTFAEVTETSDYAGLSYVAATARSAGNANNDIYKRGREWSISPVWRGHNEIYDPRSGGSYGYTTNLALCFAHELVNYWGLTVDWDEVAEEADACDVVVTNGAGGSQAKWTCNATIADDEDFDSIQNRFIGAGDIFVYERPDGSVGFKVGRWIEPTITLTEADFSNISISQGKDISTANEFVVRYVEPGNHHRETPAGCPASAPMGHLN